MDFYTSFIKSIVFYLYKCYNFDKIKYISVMCFLTGLSLSNTKGVFMNITDVNVRLIKKEGKMKAVASITIDDEFVVHDIKIIDGEKGSFIAMPSRKAQDGEYRDIVHPINQETRTFLQNLILNKYEEVVSQTQAAE